MRKVPKKLGIEGIDHHIIKVIQGISIANIILSGRKLKAHEII